eukprot:scaffold2532_cov243-Pinguiococcus_pyrenoidosus.AAC.6
MFRRSVRNVWRVLVPGTKSPTEAPSPTTTPTLSRLDATTALADELSLLYRTEVAGVHTQHLVRKPRPGNPFDCRRQVKDLRTAS